MDNQKLDEAAKNERREYYRKWRAANKDKVRQHNRKYWEKRAMKKSQEQKEETT